MLLFPLGEGKSIDTKAKAKTQLTSANSSPGFMRVTDTMSMANRRVVGVAQTKTVLQTNSLTPKYFFGFLYAGTGEFFLFFCLNTSKLTKTHESSGHFCSPFNDHPFKMALSK